MVEKQSAKSMKLAGKYATGYTPNTFPDQNAMQRLATEVSDPGLRNALLEFQYPFSTADVASSNYSPEVKAAIIQAARTGSLD